MPNSNKYSKYNNNYAKKKFHLIFHQISKYPLLGIISLASIALAIAVPDLVLFL